MRIPRMLVVLFVFATAYGAMPPVGASGQAPVRDLQAELTAGRITLVRASPNSRFYGPAIDARLRNETPTSLDVSVDFASPLFLENGTSTSQDMIALQVFHEVGAYSSEVSGPFITLPPGVETRVIFVAFSADVQENRPSTDDRLSVGVFPPALTAVVDRIRDFIAANPDPEDWRAAQGAIWLAQGGTTRRIRESISYSPETEVQARTFLATAERAATSPSPTPPADRPMPAPQSQTLPPGCMPVPPPPSNSTESRVTYQTWCRRDPAVVFQAWRDGERGMYPPRWATEVCAAESPWHAELLGYFLELPLQRGHLAELWQEGISRAIRNCDDPRVAEWLRMGLDADLAPEVHALIVTMALGLNRPEWDSLVIDISANRTRDAGVRLGTLEQYVFGKHEITDVPRLIADAYVSERLPPGFASKWVPVLLARADTREDMVVRGLDALETNPGWSLNWGELAFVLHAEMGAYSYRFPEALLRRGQEAIGQLRQLPGVSYSVREALVRAEAARRDSLNAEGRRVRRVPWEFTTRMMDGVCVPVWPDRLRAFADSAAPGLRLMTRGNECWSGAVVGDFDADGYDDAVMMAVLDSRDTFVLVLGGEPPRLIRVANAGPYDSTDDAEPGWFQANCVEEIGWLPWNGFWISFDEKSSTLYYVRDGRLVQQPGDSC